MTRAWSRAAPRPPPKTAIPPKPSSTRRRPLFSGIMDTSAISVRWADRTARVPQPTSRLAAVDSETANLSRQGEDVCAFGNNLQCLAAIWKYGRLSALPLLPGGNNSYALDMNDRGQVVGFSDTDVYDLDCAAATDTAGFRFEAVIWEPNGRLRQLAPLDGDTVANAFGINDRGQVVGNSGVCANTTPPPYVSS